MQKPETEAIRTQIQPSKPKREITKITNSQNIHFNSLLLMSLSLALANKLPIG